ncbi:MAG TPA: OmpA family protein [Afipia sp.]
MKNIRLIFLATTAIGGAVLSLQPASAQTNAFIVAQAEPKAGESAPPKAPPHPAPPGAPRAQPPAPPQAPRPAAPPPPAARPPAPPAAPRAEPPRPAPAPQARPPAPPRAPEAAPHAAPTPPPPAGAPAPRPEQPRRTEGLEPRGEAPRRPANAPPIPPGVRDVTPSRPAPGTPPATPNTIAPLPGEHASPNAPVPAERRGPPAPGTPPTTPNAIATPPGGHALPNAAPPAPPAATPGAPGGPRTERRGPPPGMPAGTPAAPAAAPVAAPLPAPPAAATMTPLPANAPGANRGRMEDFRAQRQQTTEGGRTIIREPDRVIIKDPNGQSFIRHNEVDRFRYGARDVQVQRQGNDTRTVIVRPDGTQIITESGPDGGLLRRMRRDREGREFVIIDNRPRGIGPGGIAAGVAAGVVAGAIGGYFVSLPPPVLRIPQDRYIVDAGGAPPDLIYDTLIAPPVDRLERAYSLDEIRYSPSVRQRMPSIDLDSINFETGSWDIPEDQAAKLQVIADGLNRAIRRNPNSVFLIEGHTDAVGSDVDNLSLSDRRAESVAELLSQQFGVPPENLATQGYGEQYLKVPTDGPERANRRVTVRNITPLLGGGEANAAPR